MGANPKDAKALQFIEEMTQNVDAVQRNVLAQILTQNGRTQYLKAFNLDGATDRETFKSKVPIVTYEDIQPLIRRIADGDPSPILSAHPVTEFFVSTGTSGGEGKLIPTNKEDLDRRVFLRSLINPVLNQYVRGLDKGRALYFLFTKPERTTQGGLLARSVLTCLFKNRDFLNSYNVLGTSPVEAIHCVDTFQSMYTQMLCGLYERENILRTGAPFASGLLRALGFLQLNWQQLAHDIRTGSLNPKVTDTSIRQFMKRVVRPDPDLANFIARECGQDNWEGIITRIWPNAKYLDAIVTGPMAQYVPALDYLSGGLPIASMMYASSESQFGINLNPMCKPTQVAYTIMPHLAYFEFLPYEPNSSSDLVGPQLIELGNVEMGREYELVITTYAGLYRYRVGDILRVAGFYNSAPQFEFVMRRNVLLSIDTDKTDEADLQAAVQDASRLLCEFETSIVDYTSYADTTTAPGHYVIYWELRTKGPTNAPSHKVLDQCCLAMEAALDSEYRRCRAVDKSIGPLEIRVVKNGTFEELTDYAIARGGASLSQFKMPRCVSLAPMVDLLNSRVASTHFSPSLPHWTPEVLL